MDRMQRVVQYVSTGRAKWIRAVPLALAVAGLGLAIGTAAPTAAAQAQASGRSMSVPLAPNAPETYVVKKGDTLWDIAGVFLKYPWYWPEIWYVNPQIQNPHWIYPGDVLRLVYVDGKPRVTVDRAGSVRLSPEVRSEPLAQAVRVVPYDVLEKFVGRPSLLDRRPGERRTAHRRLPWPAPGRLDRERDLRHGPRFAAARHQCTRSCTSVTNCATPTTATCSATWAFTPAPWKSSRIRAAASGGRKS